MQNILRIFGTPSVNNNVPLEPHLALTMAHVLINQIHTWNGETAPTVVWTCIVKWQQCSDCHICACATTEGHLWLWHICICFCSPYCCRSRHQQFGLRPKQDEESPYSVFTKRELSPFPQARKASVKMIKLFHIAIPSYCDCGGPDSMDEMIQCDSCDQWWHFKCVNIKEAPNNSWYCSKCI